MPSLSAATLTGAVAILLWASLALLTAASGAVPPFQLAALTFAVGGLVGLAFAAARGRLHALRQRPLAWLHGVGGLFCYHALYFAALRAAPPAEAGLICYLWPLLIVLFSGLLPGERLTRRHVIAALLGLAGVATLAFGGKANLGFDLRFAGGYALALAAAFVWAGYSVLSRQFRDVPTEAVAGFCLATAALAGACHFAFEVSVWPQGAAQWLAVAGLGAGPVGLAFYVWDIGMKQGDVKWLGVASYAAPVLSTLLLVAAGFAPATWALAVACGLIVAGAAVASRREQRSLK